MSDVSTTSTNIAISSNIARRQLTRASVTLPRLRLPRFGTRGQERRGRQADYFKVRKQLFQCGPPAEVPVTIKTIKLNSKGKGSSNYKDPSIGTLKVTITVTSAGKAKGAVRKPPSATGLCNSDFPVRFTAKRG